MALIKCSACGHEISASAAACPNCGTPLTGATPPPSPLAPTTAPARKPKRLGLWIGLAIVAVLLSLGVVVLALVAIASKKLSGNLDVARSVQVHSDIQGIRTQLRLYESLNGFLPTTEQGLRALVVPPTTEPRPTRWYQLFKQVPQDSWKTEYIYRQPGLKKPGSFDLFSAGPDRIPDTADDIWGE
jgi:general secretion pathway protein G